MQFWIWSEARQLPAEMIGSRMMVELKDRAAQLVKHLSLKDVNQKGGMQKIFDVLEASPLIKQVERHRFDEHLRRLAGASMESYITRAGVYRSHLLGLDPTLEAGNVNDEAAVTGAMMDLTSELVGEAGFPVGLSEPNQARHGEEWLMQRVDNRPARRSVRFLCCSRDNGGQ